MVPTTLFLATMLVLVTITFQLTFSVPLLSTVTHRTLTSSTSSHPFHIRGGAPSATERLKQVIDEAMKKAPTQCLSEELGKVFNDNSTSSQETHDSEELESSPEEDSEACSEELSYDEPDSNSSISSTLLSLPLLQFISALSCLLLPLLTLSKLTPPNRKLTLLRQTFYLTILNHVSTLAQSRTFTSWHDIISISNDPRTRYIFHCALLALWSTVPHVVSPTLLLLCLFTPVLLRELHRSCNSLTHMLQHSTHPTPTIILQHFHSIRDAVMSILHTPQQWRSSTLSQQQTLLTQHLNTTNVLVELLTVCLLLYDTGKFYLKFLCPIHTAPKGLTNWIRLVPLKYYLQSVYSQKEEICRLGKWGMEGTWVKVLSDRVFEVLLTPGKAMGLEEKEDGFPPDGLGGWIRLLMMGK